MGSTKIYLFDRKCMGWIRKNDNHPFVLVNSGLWMINQREKFTCNRYICFFCRVSLTVSVYTITRYDSVVEIGG